MKNSPRNKDDSQSLPPSPSSNIMTITTVTAPTGPYFTRYKTTTVIRADSSSYKDIVHMLTGPHNLNPTHQPAPSPRYPLPPLRTVPTKKQSSSSSSTIYERRNNLKINPVHSGFTGNIPSLVLTSPDTPLVHDPFSRSGSVTPSPSPKHDNDVEEREIREIREKGFYLHPSPTSTPTDPKPQLLVLFPLTSPRASEFPESST